LEWRRKTRWISIPANPRLSAHTGLAVNSFPRTEKFERAHRAGAYYGHAGRWMGKNFAIFIPWLGAGEEVVVFWSLSKGIFVPRGDGLVRAEKGTPALSRKERYRQLASWMIGMLDPRAGTTKEALFYYALHYRGELKGRASPEEFCACPFVAIGFYAGWKTKDQGLPLG